MRGVWLAVGFIVAVVGMGVTAGAEVEIPICTAPGMIQMNAAVSGTRVVWMDGRMSNPDLGDAGWNIRMYDLATGVETVVCEAKGDQVYPEIDGDRIVWLDNRSGKWEIYLYEIAAGRERKVTSAPTTRVYEGLGPDISGDIIVWADDRAHPGSHKLDVFAYDLGTSTLTQITSLDVDQGYGGPRVDDGKIVWCDMRTDPEGDIYLYDLALKAEFAVTTQAGSDSQPDIGGNVVVWSRAVSEGVWNVFARDVTSPTPPAALDPVGATQDNPRVAGRWVVWSDHRNGGGDYDWDEVWVYDLRKGSQDPLSASPHPYGFWRHSVSASGVVVWTDWRNGNIAQFYNPDIYGYVLTRFWDVLCDHWAYGAIEACVEGGVVSGYPEGNYRPGQQVTRDQMAVYMARALAGGDSKVEDHTGASSFPDVGEDHWALKYVEYAVDQGVVTGYGDGLYHPQEPVDRGQMAVYVARALVAPSGEAGLADYTPAAPRNFPDVPEAFWAYRHVEYCVEHGVVQGYDDGNYHPSSVVTRDQMAVYVQRAFGLPMD